MKESRTWLRRTSVCLMLTTAILCQLGCGGSEKPPAAYEGVRETDSRTISDQDYTLFNLVSTDELGRTFYAVDGKKNNEKYVGTMFWLTLGQEPNHTGIYDVNKITEDGAHMENFFSRDNPRSPLGSAHWAGESIYGYYDSTDPWVISKEIEMLTMSGMDFLVFDTSNGKRYDQVTSIVFETLKKYRDQGWKVPQVMYYLNTEKDKTDMRALYDTFYSNPDYEELFFAPEGKPMIVCKDAHQFLTAAEKELEAFFDIRYSQWPTESYVRPNGVPWMDFGIEQTVYQNGFINVSTAQYPTCQLSDPVGSRGKGFDYSLMKNDHANAWAGPNFEHQWDVAIQNASRVKYVYLTGWNEWVAEKQDNPANSVDPSGTLMCDEFNAEYSKMIEPIKGYWGDNFYLQMIRKMREFNSMPAKHYEYPEKMVDIHDFSETQWAGIRSYMDFSGDAFVRNYKNFDASNSYVDKSNRNDICSVRTARDAENFYFRIETLEPITARENGDQSWMNLLLSTGNFKPEKNYAGYEYVINRTFKGEGVSVVERADGSGKFVETGRAEYQVDGNIMQVKIPLKALNLTSTSYHIDFKAADHVTKPEDPMSYYVTGDSAPVGRLSYCYGY